MQETNLGLLAGVISRNEPYGYIARITHVNLVDRRVDMNSPYKDHELGPYIVFNEKIIPIDMLEQLYPDYRVVYIIDPLMPPYNKPAEVKAFEESLKAWGLDWSQKTTRQAQRMPASIAKKLGLEEGEENAIE